MINQPVSRVRVDDFAVGLNHVLWRISSALEKAFKFLVINWAVVDLKLVCFLYVLSVRGHFHKG